MGNGKYFIYFIGVDLWLIFIFQGWEMGCVRIGDSYILGYGFMVSYLVFCSYFVPKTHILR